MIKKLLNNEEDYWDLCDRTSGIAHNEPQRYPCIAVINENSGTQMLDYVYLDDFAESPAIGYLLTYTAGNHERCSCHRREWEESEQFATRQAVEDRIREHIKYESDAKNYRLSRYFGEEEIDHEAL